MSDEPNPSAEQFAAAQLKRELQMRLRAGDYDLADVTADVDGGVVTLRGRVRRTYCLRLAVDIVLKTPGVLMLMTKVEVDNSPFP